MVIWCILPLWLPLCFIFNKLTISNSDNVSLRVRSVAVASFLRASADVFLCRICHSTLLKVFLLYENIKHVLKCKEVNNWGKPLQKTTKVLLWSDNDRVCQSKAEWGGGPSPPHPGLENNAVILWQWQYVFIWDTVTVILTAALAVLTLIPCIA